jgi:hypothetical protein
MLVMVLTISFAGQLTDRFGARRPGDGALLVGTGTFATAR